MEQKSQLKNKKVFITFETVSDVLRFEKALKKEKVPVTLRPVPRELSSSCGTCAMIEVEDEKRMKEIVEVQKLRLDEIIHHDEK